MEPGPEQARPSPWIEDNVISGPDLDRPKHRYWIKGSRVSAAQPPC